MGSDLMYEALNTPNNKKAVQKVFFDYLEASVQKGKSSKETDLKLRKIRTKWLQDEQQSNGHGRQRRTGAGSEADDESASSSSGYSDGPGVAPTKYMTSA